MSEERGSRELWNLDGGDNYDDIDDHVYDNDNDNDNDNDFDDDDATCMSSACSQYFPVRGSGQSHWSSLKLFVLIFVAPQIFVLLFVNKYLFPLKMFV